MSARQKCLQTDKKSGGVVIKSPLKHKRYT